MNDPRNTDNCLKWRLNSDQPARERMCLAILALNRSLTSIEPRRPEGGPDGARDIQAIREGRIVWGAVGFVNNATDSKQEKQQIRKKFRDDLKTALLANTELSQFVFFTNVDLTPAEVDDLKEFSRGEGITWIDIYWRERLRQHLDSVEGLAYRFQYLRVPLSEEEQVSFFSHYGQSLAELVTSHHVDVRSQLEKLEFLHWSTRPIRNLQLTLVLDKWYCPSELGHVRAIATFREQHTNKPFLACGGRDDYRDMEGSPMKPAWHLTSFAQCPRMPKPQLISYYGMGFPASSVTFSVGFSGPIGMSIETFEGTFLKIYLNKGLKERIRHFQVSAGKYAIFQQSHKDLSFQYAWQEVELDIDFPAQLSDEEAAVPWVSHEFFPWISFEKTPKLTSESLMPVLYDF